MPKSCIVCGRDFLRRTHEKPWQFAARKTCGPECSRRTKTGSLCPNCNGPEQKDGCQACNSVLFQALSSLLRWARENPPPKRAYKDIRWNKIIRKWPATCLVPGALPHPSDLDAWTLDEPDELWRKT